MTLQKNATPDFTAAASIIGYQYQTQSALLLLLSSSEDASISIEKFDDIMLKSPQMGTRFVQTKHHIKPGSLTDSSPDIWKTLRIWSILISKDKSSLDHTRFVIITTSRSGQDSAAGMLGVEIAKRDEKKALELLLKVANDPDKGKTKTNYKDFVDLGYDKQLALLRAMTIIEKSPTIANLENQISEKLGHWVRTELKPRMYERLLGWWTKRVLQHLLGYSNDPISKRELEGVITDIQTQQLPDNLTIDYSDIATPEKEEDLSESDRIFVKQLKLISMNESQVTLAIGDYYRAYQQRSRWIRDKALVEKDYDSYEDRLVQEWKVQFTNKSADLDDKSTEQEKIERGKAVHGWVYSDAPLLREDLRIRPKTSAPYVMRGSYQMLSNELRVGWHIDYKKRLGSVEKGEKSS